MKQYFDDSALPARSRSAPLGVTFIVIMAAGIASWAMVLAGAYLAWTALRSLLT